MLLLLSLLLLLLLLYCWLLFSFFSLVSGDHVTWTNHFLRSGRNLLKNFVCFFAFFFLLLVYIYIYVKIYINLLSLYLWSMYKWVGGGDYSRINHVLRGLASQWTRRRLLLFNTIPLLVNLRGFRNSVIWDWRKTLVGWLLGRLLGGAASQGVQVKRPLADSGSSRTKSKFQRLQSASWWRCNSLATNWACCRASCGLRGPPNRQRLTRDRHASLGLTRDRPPPPPPPIIMARTSSEMGAANTRVLIFNLAWLINFDFQINFFFFRTIFRFLAGNLSIASLFWRLCIHWWYNPVCWRGGRNNSVGENKLHETVAELER